MLTPTEQAQIAIAFMRGVSSQFITANISTANQRESEQTDPSNLREWDRILQRGITTQFAREICVDETVTWHRTCFLVSDPPLPRAVWAIVNLIIWIKRFWREFSFYCAACNANEVLWWEFCLSVCPSVRLSITRVNCDKTIERSVQICIPYER